MKSFYGRKNGASKTAYQLGKFATYLLTQAFFKRFIVENEHYLKQIPKNASILVNPNHESHTDPIVVTYSIFDHRRDAVLNFMSKKENFTDNKFIGFLAELYGAYSLDRSSKNNEKTKVHTEEILDRSDNLLMFSEGTRTKDGNFGEPHPGLMIYAKKAQRKNPSIQYYLLPVAITYKEKLGFLAELFDESLADKNSALFYNSRRLVSLLSSLECVVTFCEPKLVSGLLSSGKRIRDISNEIMDDLKSSIKVFNDRIVAYAILELDSEKGKLTYHNLLKKAENTRVKLYRVGANLEHELNRGNVDPHWIDPQLNYLKETNLITFGNSRPITINPKKRSRLEYKANRMKHLVA